MLQEFEAFSEAMLNEGMGERGLRVARGDLSILTSADPVASLLDAARLLRAVEEYLVEVTHSIESDIGEDLEDLWRTTDGRHYVIPRTTSLSPIDGRPFLRRSLRHFRVLPTKVPGFAVRLHRSSLVADAETAAQERALRERRYGAAFFPGLTAKLAFPSPSTFTVADVNGFDAKSRLTHHLREARDEQCCAVVWGELTMPAPSVEFVRADLASGALGGRGPLRYLVTGSWHREIDGQMRNVAQVLNGYGELLFEVLKWAKFKVDGKREAIVPGQEVHVLIGEDELAIVAICRDFLQATTQVPYLDLNVDVAIVPSMISQVGEHETMDGHASTANAMRVRYGTRTMVVAQPATPGDGGVGQVMAFPSKPLAAQAAATVDGAWHLCRLASP